MALHRPLSVTLAAAAVTAVLIVSSTGWAQQPAGRPIRHG
jgi:hypothetical protein